MSAMWEQKKRTYVETLEEYCRRSQVLHQLMIHDEGRQWRAVIGLDTQTLVQNRDGEVVLGGPIVVGLYFDQRMLSQIPHPMEIATVLEPRGVFNPHIAPTGNLCLGHPMPGQDLGPVLHQIWCGLQFQSVAIDTDPGHYVNAQAAQYVRLHQHRLPLSRDGLFEARPHGLAETQSTQQRH